MRSQFMGKKENSRELVFYADGLIYERDKEKFFKNNNKLQKVISSDGSDKTVNYSLEDFNNEIKNIVSSVINLKYDNVIFLAGAGSSVVMDNGTINEKYGKTMKMIAQKIKEEFSEEVERLKKDSNYQKDIKDNLEDFLSHVIHYMPYATQDLQGVVKKLLGVIKDNTKYRYNDMVMRHGALLNVLSRLVTPPNKFSIVTTNYDLLFEGAADEKNFTVFDGFSFQATSSFDETMFDWNLVRDIPNIATREVEYKNNVFNLLKIHGSINWKKESNKIVRKNGAVTDALMIFPSSDKYAQSYQEPYFQLFSKFRELLKRKNTLLITSGFSFGDDHIATMITEAIKNNVSLRMIVTDYDIQKDKNKNWVKLRELIKDKYPIYFLKATLNGDLVDFLATSNKDVLHEHR